MFLQKFVEKLAISDLIFEGMIFNEVHSLQNKELKVYPSCKYVTTTNLYLKHHLYQLLENVKTLDGMQQADELSS